MSKKIDMDSINSKVADRSDVFYWQTDRKLKPEVVGQIWSDKHRDFDDKDIIERINSVMEDKLVTLEPLDLEAQTNLGNVNSVRAGTLKSGKTVIIRCHPIGLKNGYFYAEALAAQLAKNAGLPSYETLAVHDFTTNNDFAFQVIEKLEGTAIKKWLDTKPEDEVKLVERAGRMMARLHKIKVSGFGPFDNDKAKKGELVGLHNTMAAANRAGLQINLDFLVGERVLQEVQRTAINELFTDGNPLLGTEQAVLVHNDFADWNLLTDGNDITGILDWDECVGGDPVSDIACWSTFFDPKRLPAFLDGYWQVADKPNDFDNKFELLRMRYIISKMTLRIRRYKWDQDEFVKQKIEHGKIHLAESLNFFKI